MIVVLDASAAIEIILQLDQARLFEKTLSDSELVLAPDTFPSEITNVFWKYAHFSGMDKENANTIDYCLILLTITGTQNYMPEVFLNP